MTPLQSREGSINCDKRMHSGSGATWRRGDRPPPERRRGPKLSTLKHVCSGWHVSCYNRVPSDHI